MKTIYVPISIGELYDKLSILEIKLKFIKNEVKLKNVTNEFNELKKITDKYPITQELYNDLLVINKKLWDIEDNIREKEQKKEFDDEFIELARLVYHTNDKRSKIKKDINLKYNSNLIEEKSYKKY